MTMYDLVFSLKLQEWAVCWCRRDEDSTKPCWLVGVATPSHKKRWWKGLVVLDS